jgi:hypothetical protein
MEERKGCGAGQTFIDGGWREIKKGRSGLTRCVLFVWLVDLVRS